MHHVSISGKIALDVSVADARRQPTDPTVLFFLPWSEYVARPDVGDRYRLIASAMGARVVALDNLGIGPNSSHLPVSMRRDIEHGNFSGNIAMQMDALQRLDISLAHISLAGYSLGTSMAACFAGELGAYGFIDSITLAEPVGITKQHTATLMRKFIVEMINWGKSYQDTRSVHPEWMQPSGLNHTTVWQGVTSPLEYMAYAKGLAKAPLLPSMVEAFGKSITSETRIRIINGGSSVISTTVENIQLTNDLRKLGATVQHDVYTGETHGVIDAPRKIVSMLVGNHTSEQ